MSYKGTDQREGRRVGVVTQYMLPHVGGIEIVAEGLFRAYRDAGLEVRWVGSRCPRETAPREPDGRIRVRTLNVTEALLGVPWPIWGPGGIWELVRLVRWADVLHVHDPLYFGSGVTTLLARWAGKPVVLTQHTGDFRYASPLLNTLLNLAQRTWARGVLRRVTHIVPTTPVSEAFVRARLGPSGPPVTLIPHGVGSTFRPAREAERAAAKRRYGLPARPVVLFVGRLVEAKGLELFLAVANRLPRTAFWVVGDGPFATQDQPPPANVVFLRRVPPPDMPGVYHAADLLLMPTRGEGMPLAVQEAMASGVPVVAVQGEPFADQLARLGLCHVTERSPECLARAVASQLKDPARPMAERARAYALEKLSAERTGRRYVELLTTIQRSWPKAAAQCSTPGLTNEKA